MTIYVKFDGGRLTPAPKKVLKTGGILINNYNAEKNSAMLLADGYFAVDYSDYENYINNKSTYDNSTKIFTDITETPEHIAKIKKIKKSEITLEYAQKFSEFDTMWTRNVVLGKKTQAQMKTARDSIQSELITKLNEV